MVFLSAAAAMAFSSADASAETRLAQVLLPGQGAVVRADDVRLAVRTQAGVTRFRAWLDATEVTKRFAVTPRGMHTVDLPRGRLLRPGVHHLFVRTNKGGKAEFEDTRFVVGRHTPTLLRQGLTTFVPGGPLSASFGVSKRDATLRAKLNGRPATPAFGPPGATVRPAELGANDGLRFGRNTLHVLVFRENGDYDAITHSFTVPRSRPLAGAGSDASGLQGHAAELDGTASRPSRKGAALSYHWEVVDGPDGSSPTIANADTATPSFVPDLPGPYRVRLTVSEQKGSAVATGVDTLTFDSIPPDPPLGARFDSLDSSGRVVVAGKAYGGDADSVNLAVISRSDRSVKVTTYPRTAAGLDALRKAIPTTESRGWQSLVVVSSASGVSADAVPTLADVASGLGGSFTPAETTDLGARKPFSLAGVPGAPQDSAYVNVGRVLTNDPAHPNPVGDLHGFLQVNQASKSDQTRYGFVFGDFVHFDTSNDGDFSTIHIGPRTYTSTELPEGQTGFHVVVADATTLAVAPGDNRTFEMSDAFVIDPTQIETAQRLILAYLRLAADSNKVVFIQSVHEPLLDPTPVLNDLSLEIQQLGGNLGIFNASWEGYALVGRWAPVVPGSLGGIESSTFMTGKPAQTIGFLTRDHHGLYGPTPSDTTTGAAGDRLIEIAYQAPQAWPHSTTDGEQKANDYIARRLTFACPDKPILCDARTNYYLNFAAVNWGDEATKIEGWTYPGSDDFTKTDFDNVVRDLATEMRDVGKIKTYVQGLQQPLAEMAPRGKIDLQDVAQRIEAELNPPQSSTDSNALQLVSLIVAVGKFGDPPVSNVASGLSAVFQLMSFLARPDGGPNLGALHTAVSDLGSQLYQHYDDARSAITGVGLIVVSDPGKLKAVADHVYDLNGWSIGSDPAQIKVLNSLTVSLKQYFYARLLPVVWQLWFLNTWGEEINNARDWYCTSGSGSTIWHMWSKAQDSAQVRVITKFRENGTEFHNVFALATNVSFDVPDRRGQPDPHATVPSGDTYDMLFRAVDDPNRPGLGLSKMDFYTPRVFSVATATYYDGVCDGR